jgi:hypothetical protein
MNFVAVIVLLAATVPGLSGAPTLPQPAHPDHSQGFGEPFRLDGGDFRWIPIKVRQTPVEVDCHFEVVAGDPTVHAELLPMDDFRLFDRGQDHDKMATTANGRAGDFRRIVDTSGQYAVVVENMRGAAPVSVVLRVETNLNPDANTAQTLPPQRRLAVIVISFAFFFVTIAWSGRKLLTSIRRVS